MRQLYDEINLPGELKNQEGFEILRVGLVEPQLQIALKKCFDNPADWGAAAVEILQYAAKIYERTTGIKAEDAYGQMINMFMQMVDKPVEDAEFTRVGDH